MSSKTEEPNERDSDEHVPLEAIVKKSSLPNSREAIECFERARNIETNDGADTYAVNEQASMLALAIKKANGTFPAAYAILGLNFLELGNPDRARQAFNLGRVDI